MSRWVWFLIALGLGIAAGLYYGWVLNPVSYVDTTPDSLRGDYQTDYVLMAAEAFHATQDPAAAARQLALLGSQPPADIVEQAVVYARAHSATPGDISLLQDLGFAMQTWQPSVPALTPGATAP